MHTTAPDLPRRPSPSVPPSTPAAPNEFGHLDHAGAPSHTGGRRRRVSRGLTLLGAVLILATLLSGCEWALHDGWDAPAGRRTCSVQQANMVHVDTDGFTGQQVGDIQSAIYWLRTETGVPLQYVASPGEDWWETDTSSILIERHSVVDPNGYHRGAYSKPYDRNGDGWYDAGVLWVDPSSDVQPTGRGWGGGGSNYFKFIVHELSHQLGIADVNDNEELMGSISVSEPGWGDYQAWNAIGC